MSQLEISRENNFASHFSQDRPRIDVVLQTTGFHGWNASQGWINSLRRHGLLNRVFSPKANWGDLEPKDDDGLFEYLGNPESDLILMLGFDWHSQPLHQTGRWQERWSNSPILKLGILQEHCSAPIVNRTLAWKNLFSSAIASASNCLDALICNHEPDLGFLRTQHQITKPTIFIPFAIDSFYFNNNKSYIARSDFAFFRGNATKYFGCQAYDQRQDFIKKLAQKDNVKICSFDYNQFSTPQKAVEFYTQELREHKFLLNLPSLSYTLTSRPFEIMGCGGVLLQNKIVGEQSNKLFKNFQHLVYYDPENSEDLIGKLEYLRDNIELAKFIADEGYKICHREHLIENRIDTILKWINNKFVLDISRDDQPEKVSLKSVELAYDQSLYGDRDLVSKDKIFKVSAIVSTYNSEFFIQGCLQNLVEQTLYQQDDLEIIVIDSASQENEREIVEKFQSLYPNIIYERTSEREPLYTAWNRAIKMARGKYITNTNTDDRHRCDALEIMANYLDCNSDISLVYTDQLITMAANDRFATTQADRKWNWPDYSYEQMTLGCCVGSQPMWRKSLHEKYGYFREEFKCAGDYEFWLRIGSQGEQMRLIPEILGLYYFNPKGLEHGAPDRAGQECNLICDEYNIPRVYIAKTSSVERQFDDLQYQGVLLNQKEKKEILLFQEKYRHIFPKIVLDGVFFQLNNTGIARMWSAVLEQWNRSDFAHNIVVLDRDNTAPKFENIRYRNLKAYNYEDSGLDSQMLQFVCDEAKADLFISTYYTTPITTPSVLLAYDMVPEVIEANLKEPMWREKHLGIRHACQYLAISQNTADDLIRFFPEILSESVNVAHCGIDRDFFFPSSTEEIINFRVRYSLQNPYFIFVGSRMSLDGYKNAILFFKAFQNLPELEKFSIVCVGGQPDLEPELSELIDNNSVHLLRLEDPELSVAYSGAIALVYPSLYEGFGLPIAEAMACGCPVITCRNSSIPEVAGEAAIYVDEYKVEEMVEALGKVQIPEVRKLLIEQGLEQSQKFSWQTMADTIKDTLIVTAERLKNEQKSTAHPLWQELREMQALSQQLLLNQELKQVQCQDLSSGEDVPSPIQDHPIDEQTNQTQDVAPLKYDVNLNGEFFEEPLYLLNEKLKQKQQELQEAKTTLYTMQSSPIWRLRTAWFKLKYLFFPILGLLSGLTLVFLVNSRYTYPLVATITSWYYEVNNNFFFVLGGNLVSLALIFGIVGYLGFISANILRVLRIALILGGLLAIAFHLIS
ncbi:MULTISPECIES: glycosyltransferase [unclassified Microcystis]|jgi:glycosyltransferase involved in cell wall biosynthesis|uniref:glycosyltransferase n=1 Tax=unclassified Microcystis TaxID=2643300 RepID=UPI0022C6E6EE|nr:MULTISPECIES: glycosyltransferase [unclassified Microcystis]MCA2690960.1 glycosyltransferase [Microcystis sp. M034S2]MCA2750883.1 glycosyltransferase [Microcystis sp. M144S2]MCZ8201544.1 glycosyltransferase [Microcystis sp. LE19-55.1A]MCZ8307100.1 glycosyltransferase [Microcystis sp. LE19-98.1E]